MHRALPMDLVPGPEPGSDYNAVNTLFAIIVAAVLVIIAVVLIVKLIRKARNKRGS